MGRAADISMSLGFNDRAIGRSQKQRPGDRGCSVLSVAVWIGVFMTIPYW